MASSLENGGGDQSGHSMEENHPEGKQTTRTKPEFFSRDNSGPFTRQLSSWSFLPVKKTLRNNG